jgi:hypothetical protein
MNECPTDVASVDEDVPFKVRFKLQFAGGFFAFNLRTVASGPRGEGLKSVRRCEVPSKLPRR